MPFTANKPMPIVALPKCLASPLGSPTPPRGRFLPGIAAPQGGCLPLFFVLFLGHRDNAYFSRNRLSDRGKQHSSFSCRYSEVALLAQRFLETSKVRLCGKPLAKRKPEGQVHIFPKNQKDSKRRSDRTSDSKTCIWNTCPSGFLSGRIDCQ